MSTSSVGVQSKFALTLDTSYIGRLVSKEAIADGKLSSSELAGSAQGKALMAALQAQIASELGVDVSLVTVQGIQTKGTGRRLRATEALYEIASSFNWDVSASYFDTLHDDVPGAMDDSILSAAEMSLDQDGNALLQALQSQIAAEIGVDAALIGVHGVMAKPGAARRLQATTIFDVSTLEHKPIHFKARTSTSEVYTRPSMDEIAKMTKEERASIANLVIGKEGYGEIAFDVDGYHVSDVSGLDLNKILRWSGKPNQITNIALFSSGEDGDPASRKPAVGVGLNKPASLSVYFDKDWNEEKLATKLARMGAKLLSLDRASKTLKFQVNGF